MVLQFPRRMMKLQSQPQQQQAQALEEEECSCGRDMQQARIEAKIVELFCLTIQAVFNGEYDG